MDAELDDITTTRRKSGEKVTKPDGGWDRGWDTLLPRGTVFGLMVFYFDGGDLVEWWMMGFVMECCS